jgi:hypothetical protein
LAKHSAAAQSLVTADEDAVEAAVTCCKMLLREHGIGTDVAQSAIETLAVLAEGDHVTWRDLARLRELPLAAALAGCDELGTERLHTVSEVLQFPKPVSLLLQRQLAVFRVRNSIAAGASHTAALVQAEAALAPLLEQAVAALDDIIDEDIVQPSRLPLKRIPALWRGFFDDPESGESLDSGLRAVDHVAYGIGCLFARRGLLYDLLCSPSVDTVRDDTELQAMAAAAGDAAALAALDSVGYGMPWNRLAEIAASHGHVEVLRLAFTSCDCGPAFLPRAWGLDTKRCVKAAARAVLPSSTLVETLTVLLEDNPTCAALALAEVAACGDVQCLRWLLERDACRTDASLDEAAVRAATGQHIPALQALLEAGAVLRPGAFRASGDVATLQWCLAHGCGLEHVDATFVEAAAADGRCFQLEWAAGVTSIADFLNTDVFAAAANRGDLLTMQWLHAHGCSWNARVLEAACSKQHWPCFIFALRHGCPVDGFPLRRCYGAIMLDNLQKAVQALQDSGRGELVKLPEILQAASRQLNPATAEWLVCDLGCPLTAKECECWDGCPLGYLAAAEGCLRLLQHLCDSTPQAQLTCGQSSPAITTLLGRGLLQWSGGCMLGASPPTARSSDSSRGPVWPRIALAWTPVNSSHSLPRSWAPWRCCRCWWRSAARW